MTTDLLNQLAQNSILALLLVLALIGMYYKDKEARAARKEFVDYLLQNTAKDGELKSQVLNFMQNITNLITQSKK